MISRVSSLRIPAVAAVLISSLLAVPAARAPGGTSDRQKFVGTYKLQYTDRATMTNDRETAHGEKTDVRAGSPRSPAGRDRPAVGEEC